MSVQQWVEIRNDAQLLHQEVEFIDSYSCSCCGSVDLGHDDEACSAAAYVAMEQWRAGEIAAGRWGVLPVFADEFAGYEPMWDGFDDSDEAMFSRADRLHYA
jgi:hypothetical protein